jgi:hypothetical protein
VTLEFLTPPGGLIALVVLVPLAALFLVSRRAARVRRALALPGLPARLRLVPVVAILAVAGLLGLAAAQPLLERTTTSRVRSDAEVLMVIDISRSMLARESLGDPSRLERAKVAAADLRASLPGVPVGIASLTNRVLPHLFPSADGNVFRTTLERAIGIARPPPASGFILAPEAQAQTNATSLAALADVATQRFYAPTSSRRLLVVLTDGESQDVSPQVVGRRLHRASIDPLFLHFWASNERVFTQGTPEPQYRPMPAARSVLDRLAAATQGSVYDEAGLGAATGKAREILGSGPKVVQGHRPDRIVLAPYLAVAAFLPLTLLLWRRDR